MIAVSGLSKAFGAQNLFSDVSFQLNPGNCYGLVGANGSGKSTLLRILNGAEEPSAGTVSIPKRLRMGVLRQDHFEFEREPILDVVLRGDAELWRAMREKEKILAHADSHFDGDRYAELEDVILRHDGYAVEARAAEILEGLGIPSERHRQSLSTLSGGFKLRVLLAQALAGKPDALLLDEPTNHLDILSIRWLEKFLRDFQGLVVVISHDHRFLDNICTHILDVDYETVTLYPGNYSDFMEAKVAERSRRESEIERREKEIAHHQQFVERFRAKATKARQAQSKVRLIEKRQAELEPLPDSSRRYPTFRFAQQRASGRHVLEVRQLSKSYGDKRVLHDVSLRVERGDRLAVLGPNGIGKSTLLKLLVAETTPDSGQIEWGYETHPGYFAQNHREQLGEGRQSVEAWLWDACSGEPIGFVRGKLAEVLFSKEEVEKRVDSLSGGEAARLIFARLSVDRPNVLLLDEPTNHLDLEAIEALVQGLKDYDGTLIFVSHDRWFVSELATRVLEITPDGIQDFGGSYDEYLERCGDDHLDVEQVTLRARRQKRQAKERRGVAASDGAEAKRRRRLEGERDDLTERIEQAEARIGQINERFLDPELHSGPPSKELRRLEREHKTLQRQVDEWMASWEDVEEELEHLQ
jgi:ATPase subunit of ABC transporter with duplicated ATPase domains